MRSDTDVVTTDVLIIGGGLAGGMAAIRAAQSGAKVLVVEKANTKRSGSAGTGNDHFGIWHPEIHADAGWTIEDMVREGALLGNEDQELVEIVARTSYDRVLDLERFGVKFRFNRIYPWNYFVEPGEYEEGDEQLRIVPQFYSVPAALNYNGRDIKRKLSAEMEKEGVEILNRVMLTALLTRDDTVVGAAGFDVRTGRFTAVQAKSVVLATGRAIRVRLLRNQGGSLFNSMSPPNCTGDGHVMALRAGVEMGVRPPKYSGVGLESVDVKAFPRTALVATTSYPAGKIVNSLGEVVAEGLWAPDPPGTANPAKVEADIREGRWPFYLDLTQATEEEIEYVEWSMLHESTMWAALRVFKDEGIDFRTHKLEVALKRPGFYAGMGSMAFGVFVDRDCRSSLQNLWAAGDMLMQIGGSAVPAVCLGWRAGEMAAEDAVARPASVLDDEQIAEERARVLAPLEREEGLGWEEINNTLVDIMEDYVATSAVGGVSPAMSQNALEAAVDRIRELGELPLLAKNPHELMRSMEVTNLIDQAEVLVRACQIPELDDSRYWLIGTQVDDEMEFRQEPKTWKYPL